jgi:hypothetical protein
MAGKTPPINEMPEEFHDLIDSIVGCAISEFQNLVIPKIRKRAEKVVLEAYKAGKLGLYDKKDED